MADGVYQLERAKNELASTAQIAHSSQSIIMAANPDVYFTLAEPERGPDLSLSW